jgi:ABC-type transport system involved in cytochrome c biogenesis permease subunit
MTAPRRILLFAFLALALAGAQAADPSTAATAAAGATTLDSLEHQLAASQPAPGADHLPPGVDAVPMLYRGRVKPLAVAADEAIEAITGTAHFGLVDGSGDAMRKVATAPPAALVISLWLHPDIWHDRPLLANPWIPLQQQLGVGRWISIPDGERAMPQLQTALMKKERSSGSGERVKLNALEQAEGALANRLDEAENLASGRGVGLTPLAPTAEERTWILANVQLPAEADDDGRPWHAAIRQALRLTDADAQNKSIADAAPWLTVEDILRPDPALAAAIAVGANHPGNPRLYAVLSAGAAWLSSLRDSANDPTNSDVHGDVRAQSKDGLGDITAAFTAALRSGGAAVPGYPSPERLDVEMLYLHVAPFTWCWLSYLLGGIILAIGLGLQNSLQAATKSRARMFIRIGTTLTIIGLAFNFYGLASRVIITQLGAVTNLYETLVYVALVSAGLGLGLARGTGNGIYAVAGGLAGALCASVGEAIPPEFGRHPGQLEAVLRTNFWLFTHVKTVVGSYAAFLLALVMGNLVLITAAARGRQVAADEGRMIYRCMQVGVVLIAAGTLLGAWWADYAWGRFWGWDPKEVFALVTLLTYLVPLHLRYVGMVGPTGIAGWAVFGFMSVVASWYGVNFLLGSGLHAYAFGSGGQGYVLGGCAVQLAVVTALLLYVRRLPPASAMPPVVPSVPAPPVTVA